MTVEVADSGGYFGDVASICDSEVKTFLKCCQFVTQFRFM